MTRCQARPKRRRAAPKPYRVPIGGRSSVRPAASPPVSCRRSRPPQRRRIAPRHTRRHSARRRRACPAAARSTTHDHPSAPAKPRFHHRRPHQTIRSRQLQSTHFATCNSRLPTNSFATRRENRSPASAAVTTPTRSSAPRGSRTHSPPRPRPRTNSLHCTRSPSTAQTRPRSAAPPAAPTRPPLGPTRPQKTNTQNSHPRPAQPIRSTPAAHDSSQHPSEQTPTPTHTVPDIDAWLRTPATRFANHGP